MAAILPYAAPLLAGLLGSIPGIIGLARGGKGGRLRRHRVARKHHGGRVKRHRAHKGRGPVADALGSIPLAGMLLGPLAKAFGGKLRRRHGGRLARHHKVHKKGRGMYNSHIYRHFRGAGMLFPAGGQKYHRGGFILPPAIWGAIRGATGMGLLSPAGGKLIHHRRGHYRHVGGKRIRVVHTLVGRGMHNKKHGGYIPFALKSR